MCIQKNIYFRVFFILFVIYSSFMNVSLSSSVINFPVTNISHDINPKKLLFLSDAIIANQIYDTLYEFTSTNQLKANLVRKHIIKNKGLVYRIYLKHNVRFSDSTILNSKIVVTSLKQTIAELGESIRWGVGKIAGYNKFLKNPKLNWNILGIKVLSDDIFEIQLTEPFPLLLQVLTAPYFSIIHDKSGSSYGTGKYILKDKSKNKITLKKIIQSKGNNNGPDLINFKLAENYHILQKMIKTGEINFFDMDPGLTNIPKSYDIIEYEVLRSVMLFFNTKNQKLKNNKIRCHLASKLSNSFKKSKYGLKSAFMSFPFAWDIFNKFKKNVQLNEELPPVEILWHRSSITYFDAIENDRIQRELKKNDLKVKFVKKSSSELMKRLKNDDFELALIGWIPDYFDADALLFPTIGNGQQFNFSNYTNPTIDLLLKIERSLSDEKSRNIIFKEIFGVLANDCPMVFFGGQKSKYVISKEWKIKPMSSLGFYHFHFKNIIRRDR